MFRRRRITDTHFDTFIALEAVAEGNIQGKTNVHVQGKVLGDVIVTKGVVWVDTSGIVRGDVSGTSVVIHGEVDGNVFARKKLEIARHGIIRGRVDSSNIFVSSKSSVKISADKVATIFEERRHPDIVPMFNANDKSHTDVRK
jgi:cytoskeletal protein CcmA (bactofilin family)